MAHEFETGMFRNRPAWHGLGKTVLNMSKDEAFKTAFPWGIASAPISYEIPASTDLPLISGQTVPMTKRTVSDMCAFYRTDTGEVLAIQSKDWTPIQPYEMLDTLSPLLDTGKFQLETVCSLRQGKRLVVSLIGSGYEADILKDDPVKGYLLCAQGTDGTMSFIMMNTPVRVVCMNTLKLSTIGTEDQQIRFYHTKGIKDRIIDTVKVIESFGANWNNAIVEFRAMAEKAITDKEFSDYARKLVALQQPEQKRAEILALPEVDLPKLYGTMIEAYQTAPGARQAQGTVWGAYNAATEVSTWIRGRSDDTRVTSNLFGNGAQFTRQAHSLAMELVSA